jgi:hypothetical protein
VALVKQRDNFGRRKVDLLRGRDELRKEKDDFIGMKEAFVEKRLNVKVRCINWRGNGQGMRLASQGGSKYRRSYIIR